MKSMKLILIYYLVLIKNSINGYDCSVHGDAPNVMRIEYESKHGYPISGCPGTDTTSATIEELDIGDLSNSILKKYPNIVEKLHIKNCRTKESTINEKTFEGAKFTELSIESCHIDQLQNGAFKEANRLQKLKLSKNQITEVHSKPFLGIEYLKEIDVSGNKISCIKSETFSIPSLVSLDLSHNNIDNIEDDAFSSAGKLEKLSLYGNKMKIVPPSALKGLESLKDLNLGKNSIESLSGKNFDRTPHLNNMILAANKISEVHGDAFEGLTKLEILDLSRNEIGELSEGTFIRNTRLTTLNMSDNQLSNVPMNVFPTSLITLNLRRNEINILKPNNFEKLEQLQTLDLEGNKISNLPEGSFNGLVGLRKLYLQDNQIRQLVNFSIGLNTQDKIMEINFDKNDIIAISPSSFSNVAQKVFSFEGNPCIIRSSNTDLVYGKRVKQVKKEYDFQVCFRIYESIAANPMVPTNDKCTDCTNGVKAEIFASTVVIVLIVTAVAITFLLNKNRKMRIEIENKPFEPSPGYYTYEELKDTLNKRNEYSLYPQNLSVDENTIKSLYQQNRFSDASVVIRGTSSKVNDFPPVK